MPRTVFGYLAADHDRLDALLKRATATPESFDMGAYEEFRRGLLRHISIEEKIALPAIARLQGGTQSPLAERLRLDHGALAALLVPPPSAAIVRTLFSILAPHNALEEANGGIYWLLDMLAGAEAAEILRQMKSAPEVKVLPHNRKPEVLEITRRALERAGYRLQDGEAAQPPAGPTV